MREHRTDRRPILVTGVPRSGTTWLARWLAMGSGMALPGREPMNPRGRNYALAHTLTGWARLTEPDRRQRRALATAYRGLNPMVYSRYGERQLLAALPWRRLVVKDPFAVLSIPAVVRETGARAVLVYRHPGAVLSSYRRMGWQADLAELRQIVTEAATDGLVGLAAPPATAAPDSAEAMGYFWATLHEIALADLTRTGTDAVVVAHAELASSGVHLGRALAERLEIGWTEQMEQELTREPGGAGSATALHNLDRSPEQVAEAWRSSLSPAELEAVEATAGETMHSLDQLRLHL